MKRLITGLLISLIPTSMFAIGGFGLQVGQNSFSVEASSPETGIPGVTLTNGAFDGSGALGGFVYVDLIPFIDVEFDFNIQSNEYDIDFSNNFGTAMPTLSFAWGSINTYTTVRKKVAGLSIPFLAGAQLHAGAGVNTHKTVPVANVDMVTDLLGGDLSNADPSNLHVELQNELEDEDNVVDASGFHIQTGLQFKLLVLDTFLIYRHSFVEDVVPGSKSFGTLNLRVGLGF